MNNVNHAAHAGYDDAKYAEPTEQIVNQYLSDLNEMITERNINGMTIIESSYVDVNGVTIWNRHY